MKRTGGRAAARGSEATRGFGWLWLLGWIAAGTSMPAFADWRALAALERDGALVSATAIDLRSGKVVQELHPDDRLTPASLTKLATAAAALDAWPADKAFQTRLFATGAVRAHVLAGDLILRGAGDPSLDDHALWALATQLKGEGIRAVDGRLVVSESPFGSVACGTKDRCDALQRSERAYNAPIASVGVDFGNWCILVRPGDVGQDAQVRGCGVARLPLEVTGIVRTGPPGTRSTLRVVRDSDRQSDMLRVGGELPAGEEQRVYRAMSDSARGVGSLLVEMLRELDITVAGPVVVNADPLPPGVQPLAQTEGLTLREQLGRMLRFSNNYIADVLALDLAAEDQAHPPVDLASAATLVADFLVRARGVVSSRVAGAPVVHSGSGLTTDNRLSAADLAALLVYEYRDTRHFPAFYGGLTVPRDAAFDFLRHGSDAWLDRVALKTGTMNDPVSVCGLAGYLRRADGGWLAFALIVNGGPRRIHVPLETAMHAAQADIEDLLGAQ